MKINGMQTSKFIEKQSNFMFDLLKPYIKYDYKYYPVLLIAENSFGRLKINAREAEEYLLNELKAVNNYEYIHQGQIHRVNSHIFNGAIETAGFDVEEYEIRNIFDLLLDNDEVKEYVTNAIRMPLKRQVIIGITRTKDEMFTYLTISAYSFLRTK